MASMNGGYRPPAPQKAKPSPTPTPTTRVSPLGTQAREAQAKAAKAAQDKKILDQMEKNHKGPNGTWNNGYTN
jgi:hypothetical protein